jgi:hypothetical protein
LITKGSDAQALGAITLVLERNELYGYGVEHEAPAQVIAVQPQVNLPEARVAGMSDQELATYNKLLAELRELLPADEPKTLPGDDPRPARARAVIGVSAEL